MSLKYHQTTVTTTDAASRHIRAPVNNFMNAKSPTHQLLHVDDDEADYMDMTPKQTPTRSRSKTNIIHSPQAYHPQSKSANASPYKAGLFDDVDYEDMSGGRKSRVNQYPSSPNHSRLQVKRTSSFTSLSSQNLNRETRFASTKLAQPLISSKSVGELSLQLSKHSNLQSRRGVAKMEPNLPTKTAPPPLLHSGSFQKDDDDDYADVEDVVRPRHMTRTLPLPPTSTPSKQPPSLPLPKDPRIAAEKYLDHKPEQTHRNRSGGVLISSNNQNQTMDYSSGPTPPVPSQDPKSPTKPTTKAGRAAKKFLLAQQNVDKDSGLYEMKRTASVGVMNSPRAGVQSRIHKSRQSLKNMNRSEEQLSKQPMSPTSTNPALVEEDIIDMEAFLAKNKEKNGNSVKSTNKDAAEVVITDISHANNSFKKFMKQGSKDGSQMMKFIADGTKSRSLDKNYMEWLVKTSPYASRTSSVTSIGSKNLSIPNTNHSASLGKLIDISSTNDGDNDEAFEKYQETILKRQKEKKSSKKGNFWNRSKKDKSKSTENLKDSNEQSPLSPTNKESKKSRKSLKTKSKKIKDKKTEETEIPKESPKSPILKNFKETVRRTSSDQDVSGKPPFSSTSMKRNDQRAGFNRTRASSSSSAKSFKQTYTPKKSITLNRGATVANIAVNSNVLGHKRNHSETPQIISEQSPRSKSISHKRNKSDLPTNISMKPDTSSMLDISLASNYEDEPEALPGPIVKQKHSSMKSNTLGKIFGRKHKERKSLDDSSIWGGKDFDKKTRNERWASLQLFSESGSLKDISSEEMLPAAEHYMKHSFLVHGFAFTRPKQGAIVFDKEDLQFLRWASKKSRTLGPASNKYSTITSFNSLRKNTPKSFKADSGTTAKEVKHSELKTRRSLELLSRKSSTEAKNAINDDVTGHGNDSSDSDDYVDFEKLPRKEVKIHAMREKILPIAPVKNERTLEMTAILLHCITSTQPEILSNYKDVDSDSEDDPFITGLANDKKLNPEEFVPASYVKGADLVSWLLNLFRVKQKYDEKEDSSLNNFIIPIPPTRKQLTGMWQLLLEEGAICHVKFEEHFEDIDLYYGFHSDITLPSQLPEKFAKLNGESHIKNGEKVTDAMLRLMPMWSEDLDLSNILAYLKSNSHDAIFRKALRKGPNRRTMSELKMIYDEVVHFNSIRHLSETVKRELARVLKFEAHYDEGKVLFRQGDEGACWYIILKGSVKVEVTGKGIVTNLQAGNDFGSLALMNDAPRSATIILAEPEVHLIRVDRTDYFRILRDVEENTVRLQEHGKDVLVLEKIISAEYPERNNNNGPIDFQPTPRKSRAHSYSITAGTPERILEHILEYLQPWQITPYDETLENFILMYSTFIKSKDLFKILLSRYRSEDSGTTSFERSTKRKLVYFVVRWSHVITYLRSEDDAAAAFLQEFADEVKYDSNEFPEYSQLRDELAHVYQLDKPSDESDKKGRILLIEENARKYQPGMDKVELLKPLRSNDHTLLKVYNSEQTYATVKVPLCATAEDIVKVSTEKLFSTNPEDVILVEAFESGDRIELPKDQRSVATSINLNSCLCVCEERDSIDMKKVPRTINRSPKFHFDDVSSVEIAYHVTQYDWHLFNNVHVLEYVYRVFGTRKFQRITPNLDVLTRRFNQLAYWPPTEILSCSSAKERSMLLRKFIKIAQHLKRYQNMNAFMAIMIGIGNQAVSRLYNTWEKLPTKYKKLVQEFETILDPSRNHHSYRIFASTMDPPYLPYFPLLMKDMTFQHEGNENQKQELVNFEKMQMICSSIRTVLGGCCSRFEEDSNTVASTKTSHETKRYIQSMQVITDQRVLNEMSVHLEPKR